MKCCAAIIVAAGSSRRAGFDKLLAPLHGVRVLERSIRAFASCREITEIVVVCPEERFHVARGNLSFSTINIVKLAIECMGIDPEGRG